MPTKTKQSEFQKIPKLRFSGFSGNWEEKKLGDIGEINPPQKNLPNEFIYIDLDSVEKGNLKQKNKIQKNSAPSRAQRVLQKHDILFQMVRPYQQNNFYFNFDGDYVASTGYAQIRTEQSPMFLCQYLHTSKFLNDVLVRCTGSNYPAINSSDFKRIKINIPRKEEQQKIAEFLGVVDEWIENLCAQKENLESYKKGMVQKIFAQEIRFKDDDGNNFPEPSSAKATAGNWEEKRLGEVLDYEQPTNYIVKNTEYSAEYKTPVLTAGKTFILGYTNEASGVFQADKIPVIIFDDFTTAQKFVNFSFKVKSSAMKILKNKDDNVSDIRFIFSAMQRVRFGLGEEHKRFWISEYSKIKIPFPIYKEQQKIANFLTSIDNLINSKQQQITQAEQWKKGLMQGLFV